MPVMETPAPEQRYSFEFVNSLDNPLAIWIEPWGHLHPLQPAEAVRLEIIGPPGRAVVQASDHALTVWTWSGCRFGLYHGDRIIRSPDEPAPSS